MFDFIRHAVFVVLVPCGAMILTGIVVQNGLKLIVAIIDYIQRNPVNAAAASLLVKEMDKRIFILAVFAPINLFIWTTLILYGTGYL